MTSKLYHIICDRLRELIEGTPWEGHVFAVGGCCRDEILGLDIKDIDLAVDLPMGGTRFARWLNNKHLTTGRPTYFMKYGTAKLRLRRFPDHEIELVQTRREQYSRDNSRSPEMAFGTIEEDCFRRDFTVNSIYYNLTTGETVDITGRGISDMHAGLLRTPMDPDETFRDDPVRILRGLRFANRFGWKIEPPVFDAMMRHLDRMPLVSRERVHSELCKMLNGPDPIEMIQTLRKTGTLAAMVPELAPLCGDSRRWNVAVDRLKTILTNCPDAPTRFRLAAMFIDLASAAENASKIARAIMTTLRFDRPIVADVAFLVRFADIDPEKLANQRYVRLVQNLAARPERLSFLCRFLRALGRKEVADLLAEQSSRLQHAKKDGFNPEREQRAQRRQSARRPRRRPRHRRR